VNTKQEIIKREYYSDSITNFLKSTTEEILGKLALNSDFSLEQTQRGAWLAEISILRKVLSSLTSLLYLQITAKKI